jgi:hypothetical protein
MIGQVIRMDSAFDRRVQEAELARLARVKRKDPPPVAAMGPALLAFFKVSVEKRNAKFGKIADAWAALVPQTLAERCALESFHRGTLCVLCDSSGHLYELKQLLLAGLEKQLLLACSAAGLKKVNLKRGRWYDEGNPDDDGRPARKPRFD